MHQDLPSFLDYWRNARKRTLRVLDALRPEDLEWTYAPGRFTFGDLLRHLAGTERFMYVENARQQPSRYPGHAATLAAGLDGVRAYVERCHAESLDLLAGLSADDLVAKCLTPAGTPITTWKWLRAMVEHEAHHRGQLYLMANLRGLTLAPLFGLTEEQVAARSRPADAP
jgi:uncharacterized damage-inducible protein DinB